MVTFVTSCPREVFTAAQQGGDTRKQDVEEPVNASSRSNSNFSRLRGAARLHSHRAASFCHRYQQSTVVLHAPRPKMSAGTAVVATASAVT